MDLVSVAHPQSSFACVYALNMIFALLYKFLLLSLGFNLVLLTRYLHYSVSMRRAFLHIPGPLQSSFLWGEEWELYHSPPGKPYLEWHTMFGKVVKFTGAFGVSIFVFYVLVLNRS